MNTVLSEQSSGMLQRDHILVRYKSLSFNHTYFDFRFFFDAYLGFDHSMGRRKVLGVERESAFEELVGMARELPHGRVGSHRRRAAL